MFALTIVFGEGPSNAWRFMFKEKTKAIEASEAAENSMASGVMGCCHVHDDLGQQATFAAGSIRATNLEDSENPEMKKMVQQQRAAQMGVHMAHPGPRPGFMT